MTATLLLATLIGLALGLRLVRGATQAGSVDLVGFDGPGILVIFATYVTAAAFSGGHFALALLIGLLLHEAGHVLAIRQMGTSRARFRLTPIGQAAATDTEPRDDAEMFYVALMGAGLSLVPMALALALALLLGPEAGPLHEFLLVFGATLGALNFLMLLPFPPLDGGVCAAVATRNFWPALGPGMTVFMVAAMGTAGLRHGSLALMLLAACGIYSLFMRPKGTDVPMKPDHGLIALAAYTFTLAAHFSAGWLLFALLV